MSDNPNDLTRPPSEAKAKQSLRLLLAGIMVLIGIMHFRHPKPFESIVPSYLPAHHALVHISGACEIAGGLGLLIPFTRRAAAWGLVALFVAVFPANVNMVFHPAANYGRMVRILLWMRLPLQFVLIAWAAWLAQRNESNSTRS